MMTWRFFPARGILVTLALTFGGGFFPVVAAAAETNEFIYPLAHWNVSLGHGDPNGDGTYHMGVDAGEELGAGAPVYAVADGVVKEVQTRSSFGLVVLIEHELPGDDKTVSLYGHLDPDDRPVSPGETVEMGTRVGRLGTSEENGGWAPHIHFGLHKQAYSPVWIYYGHVFDPATGDDWYDPERFIPRRLTVDEWQPQVALNVGEDDFVGNTLSASVFATDIGSGVESLQLQVSDDSKRSWTTLTQTGDPGYPFVHTLDLAEFADGPIYFRVIATDGFGQSVRQTVRLYKKEDGFTTRQFAAMKGRGGNGFVSVRFQSGHQDFGWTPYGDNWTGGGDIAVGDVTGNGALNVVTLKGAGSQTLVKVFTRKGTLLSKFKAFPYQSQRGGRVTAGDLDGDGTEEIIVGSGPGVSAVVKAFDRNGQLLWKVPAFAQSETGGIDLATGDLDGDGTAEVVVGLAKLGKPKVAILEADGSRTKVFRAFEPEYRGGLNVTTGDVNADGMDEIVVGSNGERSGMVRVFDLAGAQLPIQYVPFGPGFTGAVDVAAADWEADGKEELIMAQASGGEAWVKTYRYGPKKRVLNTERVFEEGFEGGTRIDSWE